jgi:two-component system, chemotaxis family, protein-glutamate methylesterase/glutaminase
VSDLRILVVEDSLTIRKHIVEVLSAEPGLEVVGEASDGKTAIELCERLRPNVVTMDMMLPVMTGVAATEWIMAYCPTPILIVSASTNRGELFKTYDALAAGAVDVLDKPVGGESDDDWERRLVDAVRMAARIPVITHLRGRLVQVNASSPGPSVAGERRLVAIGASTGGPAALLTILRGLPSDFALPILVVLHISEPFGKAMAEWLDDQLAIPVRYAKHGEPLPSPGTACVLMAPPEVHLVVAGGRLTLSDAPPLHSCRPSVDVLFESLARELGRHTIACLLTGMGKDGARGLLSLRHAGALTVAQDQATSVVFGMPGEAVKLGAATHVLALPDIAGTVVRAADGGRA